MTILLIFYDRIIEFTNLDQVNEFLQREHMKSFGILIVMVSLVLVFMLYGLLSVAVEKGCYVVLESSGKYTRTLEKGIHYVPPFERATRVFWTRGKGSNYEVFEGFQIPKRGRPFNIDEYTFLTKDNTETKVKTTMTYRITNPRNAIYNTENLWESMELELQKVIQETIEAHKNQTMTRSLVSQMNNEVKQFAQKTFVEWGVVINSFEFEFIQFNHKFNNDGINNESSDEDEEYFEDCV